ncbi:hypothetical protein SLW70_04075 [Flavobacterium sp. NG2]|uniref:hypothetical protein n=1 Tax=Flavobacterium sp. NG2 TaxID=3097547 RepID=UPI002A80F641|nr:hypothetical protein [Flavobacterium sp. NG2]WPR72325.1 hypothetical protein SLW70_04075 [Flavobacterium sp. NG2]
MKTKKIILAFSIIGAIISCSSDSESEKETQSSNIILVKKIIKNYRVNDISTLTYKYDGKK